MYTISEIHQIEVLMIITFNKNEEHGIDDDSFFFLNILSKKQK